MNDFAIIETGGKQYRVSSGEKVRVETLTAPEGAVIFDKVLMRVIGGKVEIGAPYVTGAKVEGKVSREVRDPKKIVFKYHSKTRFRKKKGHRQGHTEVEVTNI